MRTGRVDGASADADPARIVARIDHHDGDGLLLQTSVIGVLQPLTAAAPARRLLRRAADDAGRRSLRIHWQALRLWRKRVPFFRKPAPPDDLRHPLNAPHSVDDAMSSSSTTAHSLSRCRQRPRPQRASCFGC